ncbi:Uncharacterized membrane protein YsdA, DUF1294 family [Oceanobacillus limi]|uniref:Uncharacterized membrane protein YsdA, DUF1294 family n=1 Tax=Oceanobacillus limi TaxID=930131 RepID=A0A1I0EGI1_9BACI|nr:DUF1294 domain-containing protein [Oceanobacillus limi]SET44171.1 Uncharacterized membrane protein YsdA, DUF1294 family [Oceanobacillus limi]
MGELQMFFPYILVVNIVGFLFMGLDKRKAKKQEWRLPERTLWGIAILGGAVGSLIGMRIFRHKTRHKAFVVGMPLLIILHLLVLIYIMDMS